MTRADLRLVAEPCPTLGEAFAAAYADDATQDAIDRASEHTTRHEDDDYGDIDRCDYDRTVGDLRDVLRGHQWDQ